MKPLEAIGSQFHLFLAYLAKSGFFSAPFWPEIGDNEALIRR
jgi:hypothetical protein